MDNKIEDGVHHHGKPAGNEESLPRTAGAPRVPSCSIVRRSSFSLCTGRSLFCGTQVSWSRCLLLSSSAVVSCGARQDPTCCNPSHTIHLALSEPSFGPLSPVFCLERPILPSCASQISTRSSFHQPRLMPFSACYRRCRAFPISSTPDRSMSEA